MKIAIVGSRGVMSVEEVEDALRSSPFLEDDTSRWWQHEFVSGGADGVDESAEIVAERHGADMTVFEPDWRDWSDGHPAKLRNTQIIEYADAVLAVWDGKSPGTRDSIDKALDRAKPLYVKIVD